MAVYIKKVGRGKPLVLFHGWGFDHTVFEKLAEDLSIHFELYLVDLPGFGLSSFMSWENFLNELLAITPDNFAVLGWSLGGLYATRLAIEKPLSVSELINVASSPYFLAEENWPGIDLAIFKTFHENMRINPKKTLESFLALQLPAGRVMIYQGVLPGQQGLSLGLDILTSWDYRAYLKDLTMPVHYLFGRLDSITPRRVKRYMEENYPDIKIKEFDKAAHAPFLSHPTVFIDYLNEILR